MFQKGGLLGGQDRRPERQLKRRQHARVSTRFALHLAPRDPAAQYSRLPAHAPLWSRGRRIHPLCIQTGPRNNPAKRAAACAEPLSILNLFGRFGCGPFGCVLGRLCAVCVPERKEFEGQAIISVDCVALANNTLHLLHRACKFQCFSFISRALPCPAYSLPRLPKEDRPTERPKVTSRSPGRRMRTRADHTL